MTTSSAEVPATGSWSPPHLGETEFVTASGIRETLDAARQKGYDEGFQSGHAEGLAKAQTITESLERLWGAMAEPFAKQEELLFREQCLLITRLASAVLERELRTEPSAIETTLTKALEVVKGASQPIEISVNSQDLAALETVAPDLLPSQLWSITVDDDLMPGGCRLQVAESIIDASIERRLMVAIREALGLELAESSAEPEGA
jgi:flagellar assembly protein FliH